MMPPPPGACRGSSGRPATATRLASARRSGDRARRPRSTRGRSPGAIGRQRRADLGVAGLGAAGLGQVLEAATARSGCPRRRSGSAGARRSVRPRLGRRALSGRSTGTLARAPALAATLRATPASLRSRRLDGAAAARAPPPRDPAASVSARTTATRPAPASRHRADVAEVDPADGEERVRRRARRRSGRARVRPPGGRAWSASRARDRRRCSRRRPRLRCVDLRRRVRRQPDQALGRRPALARRATGTSSWPTWTPSAPIGLGQVRAGR